MKKIVFVIPALKRSGLTEVLLLILKNIDRKYFSPIVVALYLSDTNDVTLDVKKMGIKVIQLTKNKKNILYSFKLYRSVIKSIKPDLIHFNGLPADICHFFTPKKFRQISTVHNIGKEDFTYSKGKIIGNLMNKLQLIILKRVDLVVSVSNTVARYLLENGIESKIVYNGTSDRGIKINSLKVNQKENLFISTGSLTKRKNIEQLLKVFDDNLVDGRLIVAGDGNLKQYYKSKYTRNIEYIGYVKNIISELKKADIFVSSSISEGLPMAAIEAMSVNLPLVLSDIPQHRELKKASTKSIGFFELGNPHQLVNLLNQQADYLTKIQCNTRSIYDDFFTSSRMVKEYEKLYLEASEY